MDTIPNISARPVRYLKMDELTPATGYRCDDLPFIKRMDIETNANGAFSLGRMSTAGFSKSLSSSIGFTGSY